MKIHRKILHNWKSKGSKIYILVQKESTIVDAILALSNRLPNDTQGGVGGLGIVDSSYFICLNMVRL